MSRILGVAIAVAVGLASGSGWAKDPTAPGTVFQDCPTCPKMVVVPKGSFLMGQDKGASNWEGANELPQHKVTFAKVFAVGVYPVTQAEYTALIGSNPSYFPGNPKRPVEQVSWDDAQTFVAALNKKTKKTYRLPSEAEWEYVARSGKQTPWYFSASTVDPGTECKAAISKLLDQNAWDCNNATDTTHPVGLKKKSPFGLFDIYGNVWEWTQDCFNTSYNGAPTDGSPWLSGSCNGRMVRGGSWGDTPKNIRSAARTGYVHSLKVSNFGFRVARSITP